MGTRSLVARAATVVALGVAGAVGLAALGAAPAAADPRADIAQKSKEAMDAYDMMDYDAAKRSLNQALVMAKRARLDRDPLAARLYLNLGITAFAAGDQDGAKLAFLSAVQIDGKIQIPPEYRAPPLVALLDQARTEAGAPAEPPGAPAVDCASVRGLQHQLIDTAPTGAAVPIEALVGDEVAPARVAVMYRPEGAASFTEGRLARQGACRYTGSIPAAAMRGSVLHYYVAAYDANNRVIVGRGSAGAPNLVELTVSGAAGGDTEDPINGGGGAAGGAASRARSGGTAGGSVSAGAGAVAPGKPARLYAGLVAGTGFGYVTGKTEFDNEVENCCIGNSLVVLTPELGYHLTPQLAIGVAARLGIPVGANLEGHSTLAPGGFVRVRYSLAASGEGLRFLGQLGFGVLRNTIKLNDATDGMDTDIVAQGPLLVGAGVGYTRRLAGKLSLVADLAAVGAIAVVDSIGSAPNLNSGISADVSVGVALGF